MAGSNKDKALAKELEKRLGVPCVVISKKEAKRRSKGA